MKAVKTTHWTTTLPSLIFSNEPLFTPGRITKRPTPYTTSTTIIYHWMDSANVKFIFQRNFCMDCTMAGMAPGWTITGFGCGTTRFALVVSCGFLRTSRLNAPTATTSWTAMATTLPMEFWGHTTKRKVVSIASKKSGPPFSSKSVTSHLILMVFSTWKTGTSSLTSTSAP